MSSQINKITRLKDFSNIVRGGSPRPAGDPTLYEGEIPFLKVADLTKDENVYVTTFENSITKLGLKNSRLVKKNTLLLTNSGATLGVPKICSFPTAFNDGIASFLSLRKVNNHFLYYYLKSLTKFFLEQASLGQGQPNLNIEIIGSVVINLPPLTEQTQIANYLDAKTQAIDKKINLLTTKIEYYKELRKTIINNAVTKGLDKNVKLKESELGIQIANNFEVKRLKDICKIINGFAFKSNEYLDFGLPVIRIGDIAINIDFTNVAFVSEEHRILAKESRVKKGDILMAMTGATIGKNSFFNEEIEAYLNQRVCSFRVNRFVDTKFLGHFISSMFFQDYVQLICGGSAQENISKAQLEIFKIVVPPKQEQTEIATYLDAKTSTIDAIINNLQLTINTYKELRKTLINDVVTGKIMVNGQLSMVNENPN